MCCVLKFCMYFDVVLFNKDGEAIKLANKFGFNRLIFKEEFNLSKGSLRRLSDGVLLVIYQIYDNYVYAILGKDSSISEASLPDLQPNSVSENEISTKPTNPAPTPT